MVPDVVARSADPEVHLVEVVGAAVEVARTLSPTFSRRLKAAFFFVFGQMKVPLQFTLAWCRYRIQETRNPLKLLWK